jgi:hypothetical protein
MWVGSILHKIWPNLSFSRDGTLITQRLHFSQGYGVCQHVLGWYRLAKELDESGVSAICVFDGETRNRAKAREACIKISL